MLISAMSFGQGYPYYPCKSDGTPQPQTDIPTFPNVVCDSANDLHNIKSVGVEARSFDKYNVGNSTFATDFGTTCGLNGTLVHTPTAVANDIRTWGSPTTRGAQFKSWNGTPNAFENSNGAWYLYTVKFSRPGKYDIVLRTRGNSASGLVGANDKHRYQTIVYDSAAYSTAIFDQTVNYAGLKFNTSTTTTSPATYVYGLPGNTSTDNTAEYVADGDYTRNGQAGAEWVKVVNPVVIPKPGTYVLKIAHLGNGFQDGTTGLGGFCFLTNEFYEQCNLTLTPDIATGSIVINSTKNVVYTITNSASSVDNATKPFNVSFGGSDLTIALSGATVGSAAGNIWTIPALAKGASATITVGITPTTSGAHVMTPSVSGSISGNYSINSSTISGVSGVVPVGMWVILLAFAGIFAAVLYKRKAIMA